MKLVINKCYGGFSLSPKAALWCYTNGMKNIATPVDEYWGADSAETGRLSHGSQLKEWREYLAAPPPPKKSLSSLGMFVTVFSPDEKFVINVRPEKRDDPILVRCVETLGASADGACAELSIVEIPDGIEWELNEYDGIESVAEKHRSWS